MVRLRPNTPFRDFRRGCCGCWFLLVLLLLVMLIASCVLGLALSRGLTPAAHAAGPGERQTVLLAPAIPAAPPSTVARGIYFSNRVTVDIAAGPVLLASTPDGHGAIVTDDQAIVQVLHADGSRSEWSHDYRTTDHSGIVPLPAQDVTALFQLGTNTVIITLYDLQPYTYSSLPYYLVFTTEAPTANPSPARRAAEGVPTSTVPRQAQQAASPIPPSTSVESPTLPTPATPTSTALPPFTPATRIPSVVNTHVNSDSDVARIMVIGGGALLTGIIFMLALRSRHAQHGAIDRMPTLFGWLDLHDTQTVESYPPIDLAQWPHGLVIQLDPLRITRVTSLTGSDGSNLEIRPTPEGAVLISKQVPVAILKDGRLDTVGSSQDSAGLAPRENQVLRHGMRLMVGDRLELGYRNPHQVSDAKPLTPA